MDYETRVWNHVELEFSCSDFAGNPYGIRFWAMFSKKGSETVKIPGFYDGSGHWMIRFMPSEIGLFEYVTESDIPELDKKSGCIAVLEPEANAVGRMMVDPQNPRHVRWESGKSYFMVGFEADWLGLMDFDDPSVPKARSLIDAISENGFNHVFMNVYAHDAPWPGYLGRDSRYDFTAPDLWPFGGTNDAPDYEKLNPAFFASLDRVIEYLRSKDIVCHLMIYVWNKKVNWPKQDSEADRRYFDYIVARYQGYSNIVWDISKEALTYGYCGPDYIKGKCSRLREIDGIGHLLTVHDKEFCEKYPDLLDLISVQDWRTDLFGLMETMYARFEGKPVFNIEHGGYEESPFIMAPGDYQDAAVCLERNYLCLFAGVYSSYYWQGCSWNIVCYEPLSLPSEKKPRFDYFKSMKKFFEKYPFARMKPQASAEVVSSGHVLANDDDMIFILKPRESYCTHLRKMDGVESISVSWFDPLSGEFSKLEDLSVENFLALRSPWTGNFSIACIKLHKNSPAIADKV